MICQIKFHIVVFGTFQTDVFIRFIATTPPKKNTPQQQPKHKCFKLGLKKVFDWRNPTDPIYLADPIYFD